LRRARHVRGQSVEEADAVTKERRHQIDAQLVEQALPQALLDDVRAADADPALGARRGRGLLDRAARRRR
jgi:hypothetical protein